MSYVFDHLELVREALGHSPFGLITDVDGTISQTASTPKQAMISPLCRQYLSILCNHLTLVAAISGRAVIEVKNMVGVDGMVYIGNHGMERWVEGRSEYTRETRDYPEIVKAAIKELRSLLSIKGVSIEDKGVTATIHYRLCPEPESVKKQILAAIENSPQTKKLRITQERMAIGLLPPIEVSKGTATLSLIREYNLKGGIYLGDDLTDIDAFRAIHTASRDLDFHGFAIGIISKEMPARLVAEADFTLNGVSDVERFLSWMSRAIPQSG